MEGIVVTGATVQKDMAKVTLVGVDNVPGNAAKIFARIAGARVVVDDIMQTEVSAEKANVSFTVATSDLAAATQAAEQIKDEINCQSIFVRDDIAEVSVVGVGMRTHYGIADKMFTALAEAKVNIDSITTSEIRISCAVDKDQAEKAVEALCVAFELDKPAEERTRSD